MFCTQMKSTDDFKRFFSADVQKIVDEFRNTDMTAVVYMFEDIVTDNVYVGTTIDVRDRIQNHMSGARNVVDKRRSYFYNIARKYGWSRFDFYILESGLTQKQGFMYEKKWIKILDSFENGFNMTEGGEGSGEGASHPQARKIKGINLDTRDQFHWDWIGGAAADLGVSNACIQAVLSRALKQTFDFDRTNRYTFKYEEDDTEWDYTISPKEVAVVLREIDTKEVRRFESASAAARALNLTVSKIFATLHGHQYQVHSKDKTHRYEVQHDPITRDWNDIVVRHEEHKNIPVLAYTKEGVLYGRYDSASQASKTLSIVRSNITSCACHNPGYRYAGEFVWEYADEELRAKQPPRKPYKGAVYYVRDDEKISFPTYKSAALAHPDPVYQWAYRVKRIKESVSSGLPDNLGIRWYAEM